MSTTVRFPNLLIHAHAAILTLIATAYRTGMLPRRHLHLGDNLPLDFEPGVESVKDAYNELAKVDPKDYGEIEGIKNMKWLVEDIAQAHFFRAVKCAHRLVEWAEKSSATAQDIADNRDLVFFANDVDTLLAILASKRAFIKAEVLREYGDLLAKVSKITGYEPKIGVLQNKISAILSNSPSPKGGARRTPGLNAVPMTATVTEQPKTGDEKAVA